MLTVTLQVIYFGILALIRPLIGDRVSRYCKSYLMVCTDPSFDAQGVYLRFLRFFITDFKVILTGDVDKLDETKNNRCVYIQNHQTELDWLFCNYFLQMFDREADFSAVMKGSIGFEMGASSDA